MREGSREQTGCFISVLMLTSAAFLVRLVIRETLFEVVRDASPRVIALAPWLLALAGVFVVFACFAFQLKR